MEVRIFQQARFESACQQFVLHRVVAARFLDRDPDWPRLW